MSTQLEFAPSALARVEGTIHELHVVVVFSKTYCPFCKAVKRLLEELRARTKIVELDTVADGAAMQQALLARSGQRTVPNVFVNGEHLGGNEEVQTLHKAGKLVPKLQAAGALFT